MTFPLLDHISNDLSKFSQRSFRYSLWYSVPLRSFHCKSTFFYFFNNIRRPLSYLRIQWCIIRFSWDRSLEKGRKKEKEEKEKWEEQKAFEWSEGACFTAFTKSRLLEGVEYLRRTGWNLIKKIHRWRSTTGMQELFCYYILLCLLFFLEKKKKEKKKKRNSSKCDSIQSRSPLGRRGTRFAVVWNPNQIPGNFSMMIHTLKSRNSAYGKMENLNFFSSA